MPTSLPVHTNRRLSGLALVLLLGAGGAARAEDDLATGTFQGHGTSGSSMTDVGITPDLVIIKGAEGNRARIRDIRRDGR